MKRHPALRLLTSDHQHVLALALQLRRSDASTAAAARDAFLSHWHNEGSRHFRIEEDVLLPAYALRASAEHSVVTQVLADHLAIRAAALSLESGQEDPGRLTSLGARLADHVRIEERQLFPLVEGALAAGELDDLGARLVAADA